MTDPAQSPPVQVDILVAGDFVLIELAALVEVIRLANRVTARDVFRWTYRARHPGAVHCRSGATVQAQPITEKPQADYLFVIGNSNPDHPDLSVQPVISSYIFAGAKVVLLAEAASRYIAETGEQGTQHTTHWENRAVLNERGMPGKGSYALAAEDGRLITSAGMVSTYDLALSLLGQHISAAAVTTVSDILLHENIRALSSLQPFGGREVSLTGNRALDRCVELMQANMEDPLRISELVGLLGLSERSLERHFRAHFATTPNAYYRELRLNHANTLLLNTRMCVREVGLACGFPNGFSSLFHRHFGLTPTAWRKQGGGQGVSRF